MLRNIVTFHDHAQRSVQSSSEDKRVTWTSIKNAMTDLIYKITCMKFQEPSSGEEKVVAHMKSLNEEIIATFRAFEE